MRVFSLLLALSLAACAATAPESLDADTDGDVLDQGKSDAVAGGEIRVRVNELTLWMRAVAPSRGSGSARVWVLSGRTSRNLESVMSFIPDDAFGSARIVSARKFEVELNAHEANSILSGLPLFVGLRVAGRAESYTARVVVVPAFADETGDASVALAGKLAPIYRRGLHYRASIEASAGGPLVVAGATPAPEVLRRGPGRWDVDFDFAALSALDRVTFTASGATRGAAVAAAVGGLEMTVADPYDTWPAGGECTAEVQACLDALEYNERDTASCGSFRQVSPCNVRSDLPSLRVAPEDRAEIEAELEAAEALNPASREIEVELFTVVDRSVVPSNRLQIALAYITRRIAPALPTLHDEITVDGALGLLAEWHADGLVGAAQDTWLSSAYDVEMLTLARDSRTKETTVLVYFPGAARVAAITLTERL